MNRKNVLIWSMVTSLLAANTWASTAESKLFDAFSRCDSEMFHVLQQEQKTLSAYAPIESIGNVARFKMNGSEEEQTVSFNTPLEINGISFVGFNHSIVKLPFDGSGHPIFYYWGFEVDNRNLAEIAAKLPQLNLEAKGLGEVFGSKYVQAIFDVDKSLDWQKYYLAEDDESLSSEKTVTKTILLGVWPKDTVNLHCSIQGHPTLELMRRERPDLNQ